MSEYTINELASLAGLSVRTIRFYIAQGLVPSAGREGPGTRYPEATLARLRLIGRLRDAHLPLAEIRKRLASLSDDEVEAVAGSPAEAAPEGSALDYVRSLLGDAEADEWGTGTSLGAPTLPMTFPASPTPLPAMAPPAAPAAGLRRLVEVAPPRRPAPAAEKPAPPARSQWERIAITEDIEIHVRRPLSRRDNRLVERLIAFARQLQGEDNP